MANVAPYLAVDGAAAALEFYAAAFGAVEDSRWTGTDGRIGHAQCTIGGAVVFLADEHPELGVLGPKSLGGSAVSLLLDVADVDAVVDRAVAAGATVDRPVAAQPDGRRAGWLTDPFGHRWGINGLVEQVPEQELHRRVGDAYKIT